MLIAIALLVSIARASEAAPSLTVAWDPSSDSSVTGYIVFYGTSSGNYTSSTDVGNHTTFTASNLTVGQTYYFAVLAYDAKGTRSPLSPEVTGTPLPATARLAVTPTSANLASGGSTTLSAQSYDAAGNPVTGISYTWTSANTGIASLASGSGSSNTVRAGSAGSTTITVSGGDQTATVSITVAAAVARVSVTPSTATMKVGETTTLSAQAFDASNNPLPGVQLTWSSGSPSVASLSSSSGATVVVTAAGAGSAMVTASAGSISGSSSIAVSAAPAVSRVAITPATSNLVPAQTQQYVAIAYDSSDAPIQGVPFTWTTSNSGVAPLSTTAGATVSVTAQSTGSATLTATATTNGKSAQASVTVAAAPTVTRVSVTPSNPTMKIGWRQTFTAQGLDASNQPVPSASFNWTSTNTGVAAPASSTGGSVDVIANGLGTATLRATEPASGRSASVTVIVTSGDTLLWDTFSGSTGTALSAHSPDFNMTGNTWTVSGSAAPTLDSGISRVATAGGASSIVYGTVRTAAPDARVAASWQALGAATWGGVVIRMSDVNNLLMVDYRASSGELALYRVRRATSTRLVGAPIAVAVGSTHQIEVAATGTTIQVYWDGTLTLQATDSFNQTVDRHGLAWANGIDTTSGYDSIRISGTPVAAAPPPPPAATPTQPTSGPSAPAAPTVTPTPPANNSNANQPAEAPFGLISAVSDASVVLQWSAPMSFPVSSYIIEAGSAPGVTDQAYIDTASTSPAYVASPVSPGIYFVRVRARSAEGALSAASNETVVSVGAQQIASCSPAQPPTNLSAAVDGSNVMLSWQGDSAVASYVVEAGTAPGASNAASFDLQSQATSYTASGVGDGTYYVRLRSTNSCGARSAASNEVVVSIGR